MIYEYITIELMQKYYPNIINIDGMNTDKIRFYDINETEVEVEEGILTSLNNEGEILIKLKKIDKWCEEYLNDEARAYGYTTGVPIITAISYKDSTYAEWSSEGQMFNKWRDAVYLYMQEQQALVKNSQRTTFPSTKKELIEELPKVEGYQ